MSQEKHAELVRAIGRWTLAALLINSIIGSGIFGMPSAVAALVGRASPIAYLIAAAGIGVIMACFAEVASQFRDAGGPYLYARATFGRFVGIQVGWLAWLVRLTSAGANANLFVIYLGEFWPQVKEPLPRALVLTLLLGVLAAVNVRGVSGGAQLSNAFTVAKLLPLVVLIAAGLFTLFFRHGPPASLPGPASLADWFQAVLLLVFAYGGFEAGLLPMGEAKDPRRDAPFALFTALLTCTVVYTLIQIVVIGVLPNPTAAERPLAAAGRVCLGPAGAALIALGALISVYGWVSGQMLSAPRLTFALAEQKDFPAFFGAVHEKYRTPYISILIHTALAWLLAVGGTFLWNAVLAAVARLFTYGLVCAALPVLRRKQPGAAAYRLPAGGIFAGLGIAFSGALVLRMHWGELIAIALTAGIALLHWLVARRTAPAVKSASVPGGGESAS